MGKIRSAAMKHRLQWMLIGLGFTFGIQAAISLIANLLFGKTQSTQGIILVLIFGLTLGAFFVGGFVIGLMSEKIRLLDAAILPLLTLSFNAALIWLASSANTNFLAMSWLNDATGHLSLSGQSLLYVILALVSSIAGTYIGWRVMTPQEGQFDRIALLIGLMSAVIGPFVLFSFDEGGGDQANDQHFPWYFLVIVILLVFVIMGIGFLMFTRESHSADDISINPPKSDEYLAEPK
jgi:MFS family permease